MELGVWENEVLEVIFKLATILFLSGGMMRYFCLSYKCARFFHKNTYILPIALKMQQHNIAETKTSVKVNNNPGGKSNWSLYWNEPEKNTANKPSNLMKYHNESNFELGNPNNKNQEEEKKRLEEEERKKKEEELNKKLPGYDPKNGGKATIFFGSEKTDYRKKDEVYTSVKVKNPPGGRSNIQFG